jgi:bifunctional DNA-binding transcriptional regulator/antitoxin component of YhaV-PrlF toxin-antitoxin module
MEGMNRMKVKIQETEDGEPFIEIPEEILEELQWQEGDQIEWINNQDGSLTAKKK